MLEISKTLELPDGRNVVLLNGLGHAGADLVDDARNVVMLDARGQTVWRVNSDFDASGDPFTNIRFEGDALKAYRWDGGTYTIDLATGTATPEQLFR